MVLPGMSDGRAFTSYESSCVFNKATMEKKGLNSNEYRQYLQNNAVQLMTNTLNVQSNIISYDNENTRCV